jgi:DNA-binding GntR family transcriptional regulator
LSFAYNRPLATIFPENAIPLVVRTGSIVASLIREAIAEGRLRPGRRLTEQGIARELGISRTPVRDAFRLLESEGVLESEPNKGVTIRTYEAADLEDMYALRGLLEGYAARRAAERIGHEALDRLWASCDGFESLDPERERDELVRENRRFHGTILDAASDERLSAMARQVIDLPLVYTIYASYSVDDRQRAGAHHRTITAALADRDPVRAEAAMKDHVAATRDIVVARLAGRPRIAPARS